MSLTPSECEASASNALAGLLSASAIRLHDLIRREKYDRVFFLSREGLIFFTAYVAIYGGHHKESMCYLFASRRNLGLTTCRNPRDCDRLLDIPFHPQPLEQLLASRFGLLLPKVSPGVPALVSRHDKPFIRQYLKRYQTEILDKAEIERQGYLAYLEKRGMHRSGRYLLVDIGYNGTFHRAFERLLPDARFESFCIAAFSGASELVHSDQMHLLLDGIRDNRLKQDFFSRNVAFIEFLLMAPHASFISVKQIGAARFKYQFDASHLKPPVEIKRIQKRAIASLQHTLHEDMSADVQRGLQRFELWLTTPMANDVLALSGLYLDDRFGGKIQRSIIAHHLLPSTEQISFEAAMAFYEQSEWKDGALCLLRSMAITQPLQQSGVNGTKGLLWRNKFAKLFRSRAAFRQHIRIFFLKRIGRYQPPPRPFDVISKLIAQHRNPV
jgi:hypothetical protein